MADDVEREYQRLLENLAANLQAARGEEDWSRGRLAQLSGLSERFLADVERGLANPSLKSLAALGRALTMDVPALLSEGPSVSPRLGGLVRAMTQHEQDEFADFVEARRAMKSGAKRVALVGLRGAGKSTVGRLLAKKLSCPFLELDRLIEEAAGLPLAQVFEIHGEPYYRRLERDALRGVLAKHREAIIETGGGLVSHEDTYALLREGCRTVWLKARPEQYLARVLRQGDRRPVERHPQALVELKALLAARAPAYRQAELTVDTSPLDPEGVAQRIVGWLERAGARAAG